MEMNSHVSTSGTNKSYKSFLNTNSTTQHIISATTSWTYTNSLSLWRVGVSPRWSRPPSGCETSMWGISIKCKSKKNVISIFKIDFIYEERKTQIYKKKLTN